MLFGNPEKNKRKEARHLLALAHKVIAYRRDLLPGEAVEAIRHAATALESPLKAKAPVERLAGPFNALDKLLRRHGGKIYPVTFGTENVEMVIVAVILAIGIRSYFFQPFKIPTNSMWPTYAGLNATIYPPDQPRPNLLKRFFLGATQGLPQSVPFGLFGDFNYYITAPVDGELVIPVKVGQGDLGPVVKPVVEGFQTSLIGRIGQSLKRRYTLLVGGQAVEVVVPGDFEIDDVLVESWFPGASDLTAAFEQARADGRVGPSNHPGVYLLKTGHTLSAGDTVLDFDINSGDMLFVDRFSYNFVEPKIGDPIVFRTNHIPGLRNDEGGSFAPDERYYIKRLVGLPGDELTVKGTTLYRNGSPIEGADAFQLNAQQTEGYPGYQERWRMVDGQSDHVLDGYAYAMGDNSPFSYDSRGWGYGGSGYYVDKRTADEKTAEVPDNQVPERDIIGRAAFIFYPFTHRWGPAK